MSEKTSAYGGEYEAKHAKDKKGNERHATHEYRDFPDNATAEPRITSLWHPRLLS